MSDLFEFDDFTLDVANAALRHKQEDIHLTPKAFEVLYTLLIQHGQLVTKEQLLATVWPDVIVSDSAMSACIRELRQALGDEAKAPRYIETVHRRGYRFCAAVTVRKAPLSTSFVDDETTATRKSSTAKALRFRLNRHRVLAMTVVMVIVIGLLLRIFFPEQSSPSFETNLAYPLPAEPSIAVLPFDNMSSDPDQDYFADGITEDIITDLSQLRGLFVIDRHSTFTYKNKAVDARQVSQELGIRYILEGSVRKAGNRLRVTAQLIDALTGDHIWAKRYDRTLADIFALQDDIRSNIVASLDIELSEGEQSKTWRSTTNNPKAYTLFLQARELYLRFEKEAIHKAAKLFEQTIELDTQFAAAYAMLGWCYETLPLWAESPEQRKTYQDQAHVYAQRALALNESLPIAHSLLAALYTAEGKADLAYQEGRRAVELNPNSAKSLAVLSVYATNVGHSKEALAAIEKAMRINPHPPAWYLFVLGRAYFFYQRYHEAIEVLKQCSSQLPDYLNCHYESILALMELGREDEAKTAVQEVLRINPKFSSSQKLIWIKDPVIRERHRTLLLRAGLLQ